jgi:hypothetical protein
MGWKEEFHRRVDSGEYETDVMRGGWRAGREIRVKDDNNVLRREDGSVCCGCGHGTHDNAHDTSRVDLDKPDWNDKGEDDGPKLLWGIL